MQCPSCGHQNRSDARFCDRCGASLTQGNQPAKMPLPQNPLGAQMTGPGGSGWQSSTTINQVPPTSIPQQLAASTPSPAPMQPGGHGGFMGIARGVQFRAEQGGSSGSYQRTTQVLGFRLEQYDQSGNRVRTLSVEMRGYSIIGFVNEGDQVEVFGQQENGLIRTKQLQNLTTGAMVKVKETPKALQAVGIGCVAIVLLAAIVVITLALFVGFNIFTIFSHFFEHIPTLPTPPANPTLPTPPANPTLPPIPTP